MDMDSDMVDADMLRARILGSTIMIHPPLRWPVFRELPWKGRVPIGSAEKI